MKPLSSSSENSSVLTNLLYFSSDINPFSFKNFQNLLLLGVWISEPNGYLSDLAALSSLSTNTVLVKLSSFIFD